MQQNIQLSIPQPCHENWDKMSREQQGRFCNACATTVVDFTSMTDEALLNFFKNKQSGDYCGRVLNIQLNRNLQMPISRKIPFGYAVLLFLILFFFTKQNSLKAQTSIAPDIYSFPFKGTNNPVKNTSSILGTANNSKAISGKIVDAQGNPVSGAMVLQVSGSTSFETKLNGSFVFLVEENIKQLQISAAGYQTQIVKLNEATHVEITLQPQKQIRLPHPEIMGKIVVRNMEK